MFNFDGSDLGAIDNLIVDIKENNIFVLEGNVKVRIEKLKSTLPLIVDELKPLFGVLKIGRHRGTFKGMEILINKVEGEEFISPEKINIDNIRYLYHFRYIINLKHNNNKSLITRKFKSGYFTTSYLENKLSKKEWDLNLSNKLIKQYYGDWINFSKITKELFSGIELNVLRSKITEIINKIDNNYIWLGLQIVKKIEILSFQRSLVAETSEDVD